MTDETRRSHQEPGFEQEDLRAKPILFFLAGLAVALILVYFVLTGMYGFLNRNDQANQPRQNPLVTDRAGPVERRVLPYNRMGEVIKKEFPVPRLEDNERHGLDDVRLQEEQTLNSYGWVDEKAGVAHIPIERAMQLVAARGLPTRPQAGAAPTSATTMSKVAAGPGGTQRKLRSNGKE